MEYNPLEQTLIMSKKRHINPLEGYPHEPEMVVIVGDYYIALSADQIFVKFGKDRELIKSFDININTAKEDFNEFVKKFKEAYNKKFEKNS